MTKRILKYSLAEGDVVKMPATAEIVHVDWPMVHYPPTLWAWVSVGDEDTDNLRQFSVIPTGFVSVEDDTKHLKTILEKDKTVWHLVERLRA